MSVGPAELKTLSRLLDEALALHPSERARWLASLNKRDAGHRNTLAQLLAEADKPDDPFLTRPDLGDLRNDLRAEGAHHEASERAGMRIGPYLLERQIGSGGMGSVWLARRVDGVLERAVALKLPHVSWVPALNARLARERDILARLTHPNIARLYDAGADEHGRPYLALEYVEGAPIDEYLRRHPLDLRHRLLLFKQVATAVAYAHAHLVVHRDLKPSNVLVDVDGAAHLLDFGVAKLLSDEEEGLTQLTRATGRMLTPGYASPEQIRGEPVTVASDVYSLGVLLFEMLTGTRPFHVTGASLTELEAAATQELAPLASSRVTAKPTQRALRGDLDTILAKALRREPEARYRTVDALIDDLDRHMNGEPVLARPASGWYRASRFVSRHSDYVVVASAALVAVLVGMGVAIAQAQRATSEARRAQAQAERADAVRDFVIGLFDLSHGDDARSMDLKELPTDELIARGARRLAVRYRDRPALRAEMMGIAGTIFADIGDGRHATEMATGQLAALEVSSTNVRERVEALRVLARGQVQELRYDLAEETLAQAIREGASLPGNELAALHTSLARIQFVREKSADALQQLDRAESLLKTEADRRSTTYADIQFERARLMLWERKDPGAARALFDRALDLTQQLSGPLSASSIAQRQTFARHLMLLGDVDGSRAMAEALIADIRRAYGDDYPDAALMELNLIDELNWHDALPDQGVGRIQQLMARLDQQGGKIPPFMHAHADLVAGTAYRQRGELDKAAPYMRRMLPVLTNPRYDVDDPLGPGARAHVYGPKYKALYLYALWADDSGGHEEATRLWDDIYKARQTALTSEGIRADEVIDPQVRAIQSRIMANDLQEAARRLASVKNQIANGRPVGFASTWDPHWEAVALEALMMIESARYADAKKLIGEWTQAVADGRAKGLDVFTFWPIGFSGLKAVVDCNTGQPSSGLSALNEGLHRVENQFAPISPVIASLRAWAGLCALQVGKLDLAREYQAAARHAFTTQPTVSSFYKRPLVELERRLPPKEVAGR
jgi:hypothetical protein